MIRIAEALQISTDLLLRPDIPQVNQLYQAEFSELLSDCSPEEIDSILKIVKEVKTATRRKEETPQFSLIFTEDSEQARKIAEHKTWLQNIRRERPNTGHPYKVGIYIRYFNQTRHENYLDYHMKQFSDTIALCPKWELVDFYIDEGSSPPNMESAPEWCRLLDDCMDGKVDLIITQKVSNVSKKSQR